MFASLSNSSPVAISLETAIFKAIIVSRVPSRSLCRQTCGLKIMKRAKPLMF